MQPLLAQVAPYVDPMQAMPKIGLVIGTILVFVVFPLVLLLRDAHRRREWDHAERMRSLEMGLPLPPRDAPWAKAAVSIAIGAGVPLATFVITYLAYSDRSLGAPAEIWIAPGVVSGISVIGGCILAGTLFHGGSSSARQSVGDGTAPYRTGFDAKPSHDPDALDVVGRRG